MRSPIGFGLVIVGLSASFFGLAGGAIVLAAGRLWSLSAIRWMGDRMIPTPEVRTGFTEDVYLVLFELPDPATGAIGLRVMVRLMVAWTWAGGFVMAGGTALALVPGRRRVVVPNGAGNLRAPQVGNGRVLVSDRGGSLSIVLVWSAIVGAALRCLWSQALTADAEADR